jgi:hypothetical protein
MNQKVLHDNSRKVKHVQATERFCRKIQRGLPGTVIIGEEQKYYGGWKVNEQD